MSNKNNKATILFWIIPIIMIVIANFKMPYGYYSLMKMIVSGSCLLGASREYKKGASKSQVWFVITIFFAVLYNPLMEISLGRTLWTIVNIPTIILYIAHYLYFKKSKESY